MDTIQGFLLILGGIFCFLFCSVGVCTTYVFARIGLDNVRKELHDAKEFERRVNKVADDELLSRGELGFGR